MSKQRRRSYRDFADMSGFEIELPSSPDPLGDEAPSDSAPVPPSTTRRLLQSTASARFSARPGTSPRKRMFALDVGNEITPQTIFVTVEAGLDGNIITKNPAGGSSVRRRLFGSPTPQPSPQRRVRTTTTTVPLRGLTDDEAGPTPRRRRRSSTGRPGTPAAATTAKRKQGTPTPKSTKKAPKKSRGSRAPSSDVDILQADTTATTPRRGRPPKRKLSPNPAEQEDPSATQTLPRKKGGRRREALGPDDMDGPLNQSNAEPGPQSHDVDSPGTNIALEGPQAENALEDGWTPVQAEEDGDLWLDNMLDPSAAGEQQEDRADDGAMVLENALESDHAESQLDHQAAFSGESDGFAPLMDNDDRSDVESSDSDHVPDAERNPDELEDQGPLPGESDDYAPITGRNDQSDAQSQRSELSTDFRDPAAFIDELDHTVDHESFTMIGLESMQSFGANRNAATSDPAEIGEGTSMIINKTLESLRHEFAESDEDEVDILVPRAETPVESEPETQAPASLSARIRLRVSHSPPSRSLRQDSGSPGRTRSVARSIAQGGRQEYAKPSARTIKSPGANVTSPRRDELTDDENSFSDIPEEVLAAAESDDHLVLGPTQQEVAWTVSFNNDSNNSDASSDHQNSDRLPSSHATPSRSYQSQLDGDQDVSRQSASRSAQSLRSNQPMDRDSPPQSLQSRTDSNRLLTPDATTSSSTRSPPAQQIDVDEVERAVASNDVGSSPPEITSYFEQIERPALPSRRASDTPVNPGPDIHVEHVQGPPAVAAVLQPALLGGTRPTLSPVVRIGRTLQNILSDPPSPSGASSVLGSPFKGSVRNSSPLDGAAVDEASQSGTGSDDTLQTHVVDPVPQVAEGPVQSPGKSWAMSLAPLSQIKNLVAQGALLFTSPHVDVSQHLEDPFAPSSPTLDKALDNTRNSAFMDRIRQASRERSRPSSSVGRRIASDDTRAHHATKMASAPRSSFKGPEGSLNPHSVGSEGLQHTRRPHEAAPVGYDGTCDADADEMSNQPISRTEPPRVFDNSSDATIPQEPYSSIDSAEEDGLEMDERPRVDCASTQRQRPIHTQGGVEEDQMDMDNAAIPDSHADEEEEDEDIWAIEADRTASSPQFEASQHDTSSLFRKSELSVDWGTRNANSQGAAQSGRSPAFDSRRSNEELPAEDLEEYSLVDLHSGTPTQPSARKPTPEQQKQPETVDLSDFFSSSPNFMERQRRAKQASMARAAAQTAAEPVQVASPDPSGQAKNAGAPSLSSSPPATRLTTEMPSPARGGISGVRASTARTSSSATPEQARHRVSGQKMTPRRAQNDAALFESWSISSLAPTERPPTSEGSMTPRAVTPLARDSSSFESPDLRPLPGRTVSPSKSCLRSPLKPRAPGRLVDFTSSTLSETAPLQVLANSHSNASAASNSNSVPFASAFPGKENQTGVHDATLTRTSPRQKPLHQAQLQQQPVDSSLSQTEWSRDHWLYLDDLWMEYQDSPREFRRRHISAVLASPGKRPSSSLLGKAVSNQGENVELQQMHLDVVDAFKEEVGGWDEVTLAKRLFALIVGAERRRLGLVPRRR
ncbi:unnamed protein product [Discula destructiva]